ncbi:unnamed protein product, partial [Prorocentrum cordatum]
PGAFLHGRCWYLSDAGASCAGVCAAHGLQFAWYAAPRERPALGRLLGRGRGEERHSWAALECHVPGAALYYTASRTPGCPGWSDPEGWSSPQCRLACPCGPPRPAAGSPPRCGAWAAAAAATGRRCEPATPTEDCRGPRTAIC